LCELGADVLDDEGKSEAQGVHPSAEGMVDTFQFNTKYLELINMNTVGTYTDLWNHKYYGHAQLLAYGRYAYAYKHNEN
jgi:hypothetical protein